MKDVAKLSNEQIDYAITRMAQWVYVCEKEGRFPVNSADVSHSSLLYRLLEGKEALDQPPIVMFSSPCYALAEGKEVEITCMFYSDAMNYWIINQSGGWYWEVENEILFHKEKKLRFDFYTRKKTVMSKYHPDTYEAKFLRLIN